jgi:hypothetical protein
MAAQWTPDVMKARIAASSVQTERVQNALCASLNVLMARLPSARRACNAARHESNRSPGRYFHDLKRKRVIETNGMGPPRI